MVTGSRATSVSVIVKIAWLGLVACDSAPCREGFSKNSDDQCVSDINDTGDTGGEPEEWISLPEHCSEPDSLTGDPLYLVARPGEDEPQHGDPFYEMLDLAHSPSEERMYAVGQGGLIVWDLEDSAILGTYPPDGHSRYHQIELISDGLVVVTHRDRGIEIIDVSGEPSTYLMTESWPLTGASGMAWSPPFLYVTSQNGELLTLEFDNGSLTPTSTVEGLESPWEFVVQGDRGWVSDNTLGIVAVDLSEPSNPVIVGSIETVGGALDITHHTNSSGQEALYVATGSTGLQVFSIDTNGLPKDESVVSYSTSIVSVTADEDNLWVVGHEDVAVLDISDGLSPKPISVEETPGFGMHIEAQGTTGWVADWGHLAIYEVNNSISSPSLDPSTTSVLIGNSREATVSIGNRGAADLNLLGAISEDPRVTILSSQEVISSGEDAEVVISVVDDSLPIDTTICLATNDPDSPSLILTVSDQSEIQSSVSYGEPAPDFSLTDLDGDTHRLSEQLGNPVVLVYFATW